MCLLFKYFNCTKMVTENSRDGIRKYEVFTHYILPPQVSTDKESVIEVPETEIGKGSFNSPSVKI